MSYGYALTYPACAKETKRTLISENDQQNKYPLNISNALSKKVTFNTVMNKFWNFQTNSTQKLTGSLFDFPQEPCLSEKRGG